MAVYRGIVQGDVLTWEGPIFATPAIFQSNVLIPFDVPDLVSDPATGSLYLTYTRTTDVGGGVLESTIEFRRSIDGGLTWSGSTLISDGTKSKGSRLAIGPEGEIYLIWHDHDRLQMLGRKSHDSGESFDSAFVVDDVKDNLVSGPPGYRARSREHPTVGCKIGNLSLNLPSIAVDRSSGPNRGHVYVTWTDYADGDVSPLVGTTPEVEPNGTFEEATPTQLGNVALGHAVSADVDPGNADRDFFVFEGDRGTTIALQGRVSGYSGPACEFPSFPCLVSLLSCAGGQPGPPARLGYILLQTPDHQPLPPYLFTLPVTGRYYLEMSPAGACGVFYQIDLRTLTPGLGQAAQDHRDIVLVTSSDGGTSWSSKVRVNDDAPLYDNSYPSVAVDELGQVHVVWYDRRDDPDCGSIAQTYWTVSRNGGLNFESGRKLSDHESRWFDFFTTEPNIGDHLGLTSGGEQVYAVWVQMGQPDEDIYGVAIHDVPTAAALGGLEVAAVEDGVRIRWHVIDSSDLLSFQLQRAEAGTGIYAPLEGGDRKAAGEGVYEIIDRSAQPGHAYEYRLEAIRGDGGSEWLGPIRIDLPLPTLRLSWTAVQPNPFDDEVQLALGVPRCGLLRIGVYDLAGREVTVLHAGDVIPGIHRTRWNGKDRTGNTVPAGLYFVWAQQGSEILTTRIVRAR